MSTTLKATVRELLENAEANGYPLWDWQPDEIVDDLRSYDADMQDVPRPELFRVVKRVLAEHNERN